MNRKQALEALAAINTERATVQGQPLGRGFFFADAVAALGDFERAARHVAALTKAGAVRCTVLRLGFSSHDFYSVNA